MTVHRIKSYTADTGYVWQYHFEEVRSEQTRSGRPGSEYVFVVSRDRKTNYPVPVFLSREALDAWAAVHGRALSGAEQYAAVKMRLFRAFDEIEDLEPARDRIEVTPENIAELLAPLVE
ncbi:MAG: hypothetical protein ACRD5I_12915 [Candidatus Acidiferrales bacterium]